jgi:glyoxylase-like metal-dependent hydrolase (beta-lactamase superfamily II)
MKSAFHCKRLWIILLFSCIGQFGHSQEISTDVRITAGAVNGVFIERDGKTLVVYGDPKGELKKADMVLFTHFRRDVIGAGRTLVAKGAAAVAPAAQREYFTKGDSIWMEIARKQFREHSNRTTKIAALPINVNRFVKGGETLQWQDLKIKVLNTPGYTRGSVSYFTSIDNKRFAFVGDLIYGDGKLFDLYSFQDSLKGGIDGNHGYAARLGHLIKSLQLIAAEKPDIMVPARGPVITNPDEAIKKLIQRIHKLYQNYLSITAQRWNHTDRMITLSKHVLGEAACVDWMPFASVIQNTPPSWYKHQNCANLVIADDGAAFMIDCGTKKDLDEVRKLKASGRIKSLDGIFITHYHYDHTDFVNDAVKEFGCPVYVTQELKGILEDPGAYHMPSMTSGGIPNLTIMKEGQKMSWKDFEMTFVYFPGQTLYHDGLLMEKSNGEAVFFTGDSFTPAGIDDYCFQNRNILHEGTGYLYCLDVLKKLPANVMLSNQHIKPLFRFSPQQLEHMTTILRERNAIIKDLLPWDDVNYGTDDQWVWVFPYGQKTKPGETVSCTVKIFNYSDVVKTFTVKPNVPSGFKVVAMTTSLTIQPRSEGSHEFKVRVPKKASPGVVLFTADIKFDNWELNEWSEAFIEIEP